MKKVKNPKRIQGQFHENPTIFGGFGGQNPPRSTPGGPREPRKVPRGSPEGSQGAPGEAQGVPESSPGAPKVAQGSPKGRPKPPKSSQKHPQERKIEAKTHPRSISKPMSVENHIRSRFSSDFALKSLPEPTGESMANFEEKFRRSCHRSTKRCSENHSFTLAKPHFS